MFDPRSVAAAHGIAVDITDLGDWGAATLISEYDPLARVIRINERALDDYRRGCGALSSCDTRTFIDRAIAHELYHYREAAGEVPRLANHRQREQAAEAYARANVPVDARLDAFIKAKATT